MVDFRHSNLRNEDSLAKSMCYWAMERKVSSWPERPRISWLVACRGYNAGRRNDIDRRDEGSALREGSSVDSS